MTCGCLLLAASVGCIALGIEGIHNARTYQHPRTLTYAQFAKAAPKEGWFRVTGCRLDVLDAVYETVTYKGTKQDARTDPTISRVWVPVEDASKDPGPDARVSLVLETQDEGILSTVREMARLEREDTGTSAIEKWARAHVSRLSVDRDVQGMVQSGILASDKDREQVARLAERTTPDYAILVDGKTPGSVGGSVALLVFGIFLGVLTILLWVVEFLNGASCLARAFGATRRAADQVDVEAARRMAENTGPGHGGS